MANQQINLHFVLGGAVSAGAYTAGVLDFLIDRLKEFMSLPESERVHDVKIKSVAGASAGGMCGAILTNGIAKGWPYKPNSSAMYKAWVEEIDIQKLSGLSDLKNGKVTSLLNGDPIQKIAKDALADMEKQSTKLPDFVHEDFKLILSITNTKGLSYAVNFINPNVDKPYFITNHRDYFKFCFKKNDDPEYIVLNNKSGWNTLQNAAVATGAFPIGLPPVSISRPSELYENRLKNTGLKPFNIDGEIFTYSGIDGGTVDNEPLDQVRKLIKDENDLVIFIDPFPSERKENKGDDIINQLGRLYTVFRNQSAFKPNEIEPFIPGTDNHQSKFNGFFIAPNRPDSDKDDLQVAGGAFNAFGGFFHQSFRQYDYILGKRNCQKFLKDHFKIPNTDKPVIQSPTGEEIEPALWPSITQKEFKIITKPLTRRIRKVIRLQIGGGMGRIASFITRFLGIKKKISKSFSVHNLISK